MEQAYVVQRDLTGGQFHIDGVLLVDLVGQFLPTGEHIVLVEGVAVPGVFLGEMAVR